jgi:uncharacterized protein (TIGR02466 family)
MNDIFFDSEPICIFPSILKKYSFNKPEELKECIVNIITEKQKENDYNSHHSETLSFFNNVSGDSLFKQHSNQFPILKEFEEFCLKCANHFSVEILDYAIDGEMICTNSWVNYYSILESHQEPHVHVNSLISSNYFVNYDKKVHAPLFFKKAEEIGHISFLSQKRKNANNPALWDTAYLDYNEGDIVFWQSHIFHYVPKSLEIGRISLACNYMPSLVDLGGYGFKVSPA